MCALRGAAMYLGIALAAIALSLAARLAGRARARAVLRQWNRFALWWIRACCGIRYRVRGLEHIPAEGPYLIVSNHQSAFETILYAHLFPHAAFVLKQSLMRIPFFGWGLRMSDAIPLRLDAPVQSMRRLLDDAGARFAAGRSVMVFPEGRRLPPGARRAWQTGAAHIAVRFGVAVIPMVHNAGHVWPKRLCKAPGVVTVRIGAAVRPDGLSAAELNRRLQEWTERAGAALRPPA